MAFLGLHLVGYLTYFICKKWKPIIAQIFINFEACPEMIVTYNHLDLSKMYNPELRKIISEYFIKIGS